MRIVVACGYDPADAQQTAGIRDFGNALGAAIAEHGHVLMNGCRTELDAIVAEGAYMRLEELGEAEPEKKRIVCYVLANHEPSHGFGTIIRSRLANWEIAQDVFYIPEQVQQADAIILVGGFEGTFQAANWARIAGKPLLPFTGFGGAAQKIYAQELNEFDAKYSGLVDQLEYEQLNSLNDDWNTVATDIVALAEKLAVSRRVQVIMSYEERSDLIDAYDSFREVTEKLEYRCEKLTQVNAGDRILPDVLERIKHAAFVIVDLTDLRPNVLYELGYADGLNKKVVVTAKKGTELPFDVKDIPTIFWEGQTQLKLDLRTRILEVAPTAVPSASPPIGPS